MSQAVMIKQRWYDNMPVVGNVINKVEVLPQQAKSVVASATTFLAEREYQADIQFRSFRSLGQEKVLSLYKAARKQRGQDQEPELYKALNYWLILSPQNQRMLAKEVDAIVRSLQEYLQMCLNLQVLPQVEEIQDLANNYLEGGEKALASWLGKAEAKLLTRLSIMPVSPSHGAKSSYTHEDLTEDEGGMKLKGPMLE